MTTRLTETRESVTNMTIIHSYPLVYVIVPCRTSQQDNDDPCMYPDTFTDQMRRSGFSNELAARVA